MIYSVTHQLILIPISADIDVLSVCHPFGVRLRHTSTSCTCNTEPFMLLSNDLDRWCSATYFPKQKSARRGGGWGWVKSLKHDFHQCQFFSSPNHDYYYYYYFFQLSWTEVDLCVSLCVSKSDQRKGLESRTKKPEGLLCFWSVMTQGTRLHDKWWQWCMWWPRVKMVCARHMLNASPYTQIPIFYFKICVV